MGPDINGETIYLVEGETKPIQIRIVDPPIDGVSADANIEGAMIRFGVHRLLSKPKDCTISGSIVTVTLDPADTIGKPGSYLYEFKLKDGNLAVNSLVIGMLEVSKAAFTDMSAI